MTNKDRDYYAGVNDAYQLVVTYNNAKDIKKQVRALWLQARLKAGLHPEDGE